MKLVLTSDMSKWDAYTLEHVPLFSSALMERAAHAVFLWLDRTFGNKAAYCVICGPGNNGGDGFCIARMLYLKGRKVEVWYMDMKRPSADNQLNKNRLHACRKIKFSTISEGDALTSIDESTIIVDAWMGTGFNGIWGEMWAEKVRFINSLSNRCVSVDIPSGIFDLFHENNVAVEANYTLTFQQPKRSFFYPSTSKYIGNWIVLDIGLHSDFLTTYATPFRWTNIASVRNWIIKKYKFTHKGRGGHAFIVAGSTNMPGASVMAVEACVKTGAALVSYSVPKGAMESLVARLPEAMIAPVVEDKKQPPYKLPPSSFIEKVNAIGIGPGLGQHDDGLLILQTALESQKPLVIDADALNMLAQNPVLLSKIPENTILTPHPGEFMRLFGIFENDYLRDDFASNEAVQRKIIIVLKGAYSRIFLPSGEIWYNTTGNPGMAKGGTGDVLTGIITSLLAQGYPPDRAAILGTYLHGIAGDIAASIKSENGMNASDVVFCISEAWKTLLIRA